MENRINSQSVLHHFPVRRIYEFLIFFLLMVPDDVFRMLPLYTNKSPNYIVYKWLDYSYNIILFTVMLTGLLVAVKKKDKVILGLTLLVFFRELIFLLLGENSCFTDGSYEIYLTLFTGVALAIIVQDLFHSVEDHSKFFWFVMVANAMTVYIAYAMGLMVKNSHRYNAINLDVGSTGTICSLIILYCIFSETIRYRLIIAMITLVALFLSGSRINLLFVVFFLLFGIVIRLLQKKSFEKKSVYGFVFVAMIGMVLLMMMDANSQNLLNNSSMSISRMISSFSFSEMEDDTSVLGRTRSIFIGFDIIKHHPFGISGYFTNLQVETVQRGFYTFPHSLILDYYIFLGPILILLVIRIIRCLVVLFKREFSQFMVLLYLLAFVTFSGGPIVNFKLVFFYATIILISIRMCKVSTEISE